MFHALGIALDYARDERLRSATVLSPQWVTDGIYTLLREAVSDDGSAELTLARVAKVLPKEPPVMRRYLVDLMRRFDLAFPLDETGDRWLVPQRLRAEQPVLGPEWTASDESTRLRYRYPVIPEGLLPRFITRTYPLSTSDEGSSSARVRWANGVVLEDRNAKALVRVDIEQREIQVIVLGPLEARLSLLGVIQADFRTIHGDITGLDVIEELEVSGQHGRYLAVETLRADESKRQTSSLATPEGTVQFDPSVQLNRLSSPEARDDRLWRAKLFISYSSTDVRFKDELMIRLKPMQASLGLVDWWYDRCIPPGADWDRDVRRELEEADVVLLLVSSRFLASEYIRDVEVRRAVERADHGSTVLLPIILEQCAWKEESFGRFNALPRKGFPVRSTSPQRDAWYAIDEELRQVLRHLRSNRTRSARHVT